MEKRPDARVVCIKMFIEKIEIKNFRLFSDHSFFKVDNFNIPNEKDEGSGITVFVGENGCGKTSLLDAISLPLLSFKAESFSINDFYNPEEKTEINIFSEKNFDYAGVMPKAVYKAKGFSFLAGIRARENKAYLSSMIVTDQKFIKADGELKPEENSPDLRVSVNNPFKGQRFNDNDVIYLDKNRLFQIKSGTYNTTRFDRLMEDFDYQYIKSASNKIINLNKKLNQKIKLNIKNDFLASAVAKFNEISGTKITLDFINNWKPFNNCFFAEKKKNNQQIPISMLGSGYEMIFSLIYSFYLSQQSEKQLIVLIDEPELHLHPSLQELFVKILLEFSKIAQIILTTHSPLFVKQLMYNDIVKVKILRFDKSSVSVQKPDIFVLPYLSSNETNYLSFHLPTEEYHNELYEELKSIKWESISITKFDDEFFIKEKGEQNNFPNFGEENKVSVHTFIRNQIHHRKELGSANIEQIKSSVDKMRQYLLEIKKINL